MDELRDKVSHDSYWMDIRMYCTRADADIYIKKGIGTLKKDSKESHLHD